MSIKQLFIILIILILTYFMLAIFIFKNPKIDNVEYKMNKDELTVKEMKKKNYIYYEITDDTKTFSFKINKTSGNYLIKDIIYANINEYTCIYPIFKNNVSIDILCNKDDIVYPYKAIKGLDKKIDEFKSSIDSYKEEENKIGENVKKDSITIYKDNIKKNTYIAIENYKGLYLVNKKDVLKNIELFDKDVYKKDLSYFNNNKYLVADYNKNYSFHEFYLVDIKTGKINNITRNKELKFDATVMGNFEDKIYIYDESSKEQYTVNTKKSEITKVGDAKTGLNYYENGEFIKIGVQDIPDIKFNKYTANIKDLNYDRVDLIENDYYLYEKGKYGYTAYKAPVENKNNKTYLFTTTDIDNITYIKDDIYFIYKNELNYHNDNLGIKKVLENKEFEYNKNIKIGIFNS